MKKAYDIKIKDLKELLVILKQCASNDSMVQIDILRLTNYIKRLERNFVGQPSSLYGRLLDDSDEIHFFKPFYPYSEKFSTIGRPQEDLLFQTTYSNFIMSDEQAVDDADTFFKSQGDFFYSLFKDYKEEAPDHLKFVKQDADTAGETFTLRSTGEAFVFVPNYSNITKFTILVHEIEHVIDFFARQDFLDEHIICEASSIFMELLAADFVAQKYKLFDDNFQRRNFLHTLIKSQATILKDKIQLLELVNKHKDLNEAELFKYLDKCDYSEEDLEFYLEANISQDSSYQIPYLIAVELYIIYHQNKKLALKILEDIILNGNQYNILVILDKYGIVLNKHMLQYEDCLYKKITL